MNYSNELLSPPNDITTIKIMILMKIIIIINSHYYIIDI